MRRWWRWQAVGRGRDQLVYTVFKHEPTLETGVGRGGLQAQRLVTLSVGDSGTGIGHDESSWPVAGQLPRLDS